MVWSIWHRNKKIAIETSVGWINISHVENQILNKILSGTSTVDEGNRLYQMIIARGLSFPLEWEILVLQSTLKEMPDRQDLLQRLKEIQKQAALKVVSDSDSDDIKVWELAWTRFSKTSLIGNNDAEYSKVLQNKCFADACTLLSNPHFQTLEKEKRVSTILALHDTLMSAPSPEMIIVADLALRQFSEMLSQEILNKPEAMALYDALHGMYFSGTSDVLNLRRFDSIVPIYETFLRKKINTHTQELTENGSADSINVAYLLHTGHFDRGNAVSPLVVSLAESHGKYPNRQIYLYLVQYVGPNFLEQISERPFIVRNFAQGRDYARMEEIISSIRTDKINVIITEQNRAIASELFVQRVAPLQIWADTGFPYWSLESLDWTLSPIKSEDSDKAQRRSHLTWQQNINPITKEVSASEIAATKMIFPINAFIIGVFARLVKLNDEFLDMVDQMLGLEDSICLVIAGTGDASIVHNYIKRSKNASRIFFIHENVDLNIWGQIIGVMCDTFPFIGGNACREISAHGAPVVSMHVAAWKDFLIENRSPVLLASSKKEYIDIVLKLFHDHSFQSDQREFARQLYSRQTDAVRMIGDVEAGIALAATARGVSLCQPV